MLFRQLLLVCVRCRSRFTGLLCLCSDSEHTERKVNSEVLEELEGVKGK